MVITNLQRRVIPAPPAVTGPILDAMADPAASVWPAPPWWPLRLDDGLRPGSRGGHGAIRYEVAGHEPGRWARFTFHPALGLDGYHEFVVRTAGEGTEVTHLIAAAPHGRMRWLWPLAVRWLHEALLQDLLDNWERHVTGTVRTPARWSPWVRLLRRAVARLEPFPEDDATRA